MKIYVDELPECCMKCPCMNDDIDYGNNCNISKVHLEWDECQSFRHKDCPLETTQSLKQQVREEVVEQVNDYMKKHSHTIPVISKNRRVVYNIGLTRFLDQVKGEGNE